MRPLLFIAQIVICWSLSAYTELCGLYHNSPTGILSFFIAVKPVLRQLGRTLMDVLVEKSVILSTLDRFKLSNSFVLDFVLLTEEGL